MKKLITSVATLATLGLSLAACSNNNQNPNPGPLFTPVASGPTKYVQIERLSRPAVKEVFEPFVDHQKSNASEPYADSTIQGDIKATEDAIRPPSGTTDYGATLASVLYPDEYTVNLNGSAPSGADPYYFLSEVADSSSAFGGRAPNDDVIGLELGILFGHTLPALKVLPEDNEENDCISAQNLGTTKVPTTSSFPYLAAAH